MASPITVASRARSPSPRFGEPVGSTFRPSSPSVLSPSSVVDIPGACTRSCTEPLDTGVPIADSLEAVQSSLAVTPPSPRIQVVVAESGATMEADSSKDTLVVRPSLVAIEEHHPLEDVTPPNRIPLTPESQHDTDDGFPLPRKSILRRFSMFDAPAEYVDPRERRMSAVSFDNREQVHYVYSSRAYDRSYSKTEDEMTAAYVPRHMMMGGMW